MEGEIRLLYLLQSGQAQEYRGGERKEKGGRREGEGREKGGRREGKGREEEGREEGGKRGGGRREGEGREEGEVKIPRVHKWKCYHIFSLINQINISVIFNSKSTRHSS